MSSHIEHLLFRSTKFQAIILSYYSYNLLLDSFESHKGICLVLQMAEQCEQRGKLLTIGSSSIRTTIHALIVHWRAQIAVQGVSLTEVTIADITLPERTVERAIGSRELDNILIST